MEPFGYDDDGRGTDAAMLHLLLKLGSQEKPKNRDRRPFTCVFSLTYVHGSYV